MVVSREMSQRPTDTDTLRAHFAATRALTSLSPAAFEAACRECMTAICTVPTAAEWCASAQAVLADCRYDAQEATAKAKGIDPVEARMHAESFLYERDYGRGGAFAR